jgi:hypothetical protein
MNIEVKYNFNDWVYPIFLRREEKWIPCKSCNATGEITLLDGEVVDCPKCYGRKGEKEWLPQKWMINEDLYGQIKNIRTELYNNKKYGNSEIRYMITSTGIGSGTLWYEKDLFLTKEEAQKECDKRNKTL